MGALDGKIVFVAGGAGNIGGALVRGALRAGALVVTSSRTPERFERLRRFVEAAGFHDEKRLVTLTGDVGTLPGALELRERVVKDVGVPDVFCASLGGGMAPTTLMGMTVPTWEGVLRSNLTSHFVAAHTFLPAMMEQGRGAYLLLSGHAAETSWPEAAPVSVASMAVIALARNLWAENRRGGVRIKPVVLVTTPELWPKMERLPGAHKGDDIGDFVAWLASDEGGAEEAEVIRFVTTWAAANAMLRA